MEADFRREFWVVNTRHSIIHIIGNIGYQTRKIVVVDLIIEVRSGNARRYEPPQDNRWHFAQDFDPIEGGKVIIDRCKEYQNALTQMVDDWENNHSKSP